MSSLNLNKVVLAGRLTADPELKQTTSGISVTSFNLAINRRFAREGEQTADFIACVAWRQSAEFICKYFRKGSALCITGNIQTRSWQDQQGNKRFATEVVIDEAMFVDSKNDTEQAQAPAAGSYIPEAYTAPQAPNFVPVKQDDDLPF